MKLSINLATRRYVNLGRLNALLIAGFLILGAFLILKVREAAYNQAEIARIKTLSAASDTRPGETPVSDAQMRTLATKIAFANRLIEKKSVNWLELLDRLEEVVPGGVAITQIDPSQLDQSLKISAATRDFANLRTLLENMERSKNFSEVYLLSQSETKVGLTQQGISFVVSCKVNYR